MLCPKNIFNKLSFRDFDEPLGLRLVDEPIGSEPFGELRVSSRAEKLMAELLKSSRSGRRLCRAVKREILRDLSRYKISPGVYPELIEGVEMTT